MVCPHCESPQIRNLNRRTELGYAVFRCGRCRRKSNERTGTPFNFLELPTDIVFEIVLCRLRYKLSLRNLAECFCGADSGLLMKPYGSGRNASLPCWLSDSDANGKGRRAGAGRWTKHM
jgi:hypothetical protein